MNIEICPNCGMRVIPTAKGICPSCQKVIPAAASSGTATNPFADDPSESAGVHVGTAETLNPYASSSLIEITREKANPLLVPASILLVGGVVWFVLTVCTAGMLMFTKRVLARLPQPDAVGEMIGYLLVVMLPVITIAGAISMINRRSKQTAWAGACVALIPAFGTCYGLLIPFAIWAIVVMCRDDVSREFRSK